MYKQLIKPILFRFQPEKAHHIAFSGIKFLCRIPLVKPIIRRIYKYENPKLERTVFGLKFPNPVGLAAGFDKDAKLFDELACFGFGFVEIGTLTPVGQPGNPQPRSFRLPEDVALINRMGFNNEGVDAAVLRLKKRNPSLIIGGNIGKNKVTPNEEAVNDYEKCFHALFNDVDYFVVNVSSPNTPGLRELQDKDSLKNILLKLQNINNSKEKPKPLLLKIAPDLTDTQLDDIVSIAKEVRLAGIIATNTTISRDGLRTDKSVVDQIGAGGLSGKPLTKRSTEVVAYLCQRLGKEIPVIAVGGIHSAADAIEKLNAGAALVQLYTGFIYEGPGLIKEINKALASK
ncbi:MAG: quinone-dependent dihydroorotate dehydrogenase [Flavobacteriales bacterium]